MIAQGGQGWATTIADLSLILFMITAADLSNAESAAKAGASKAQAIATADAVAFYSPGKDAPPLRAWLAAQPYDPRQRVTVVVHYRDALTGEKIDKGARLLADAQAAGRDARLIAEKSDRVGVSAILAYDADPRAVARELQDPSHAQMRSNTENSR